MNERLNGMSERKSVKITVGDPERQTALCTRFSPSRANDNKSGEGMAEKNH